uniref:Prephenate/arogenate dehydrogenase domain-containing protein n=1 Tax=Leersia perrieri TaxID=77586 RepID=A0A0D9WR03_9ORYZ
MASSSSPHHSTHHPTLLRRSYPNFCAITPLPLRPTRHLTPAFATAPCHAGDDPSPPDPTTTSAAAPSPLRVGIVGFGNFGQFIAGGIQRRGHAVLATSRSDYSHYCARRGILFFPTADALCEAGLDVLLICSSILSTESVARAVPFHKLRPDAIVADVLSVKQFPRNLLLQILPPGFGIVCTHPMFGPESGKHGWSGLPFVYDKVRVAQEGDQAAKCQQFLSIFEQEGCRMVEMSCAEHDRYAAGSQFITHTIGRVLAQLKLKSTPINTKGYETLLKLTENTMDNLERAFAKVKQMLYDRLHNLLRKQIVERVPTP